ncbi:MAG: diadenylate cyclase CdaA [Bacteroidales bacterium]|nr:diadenylate cyclase CdaA [Bacteroidales bacterium]
MNYLAVLGFLHLSLTDALDILLVAFLIYFAFRWIKDTAAMNIFLAILLLLVFRLLVEALNMKMVSSLLGTVIDVGVIALIIIFQPEIRHFLIRLGNRTRFFAIKDKQLGDADINEIVDACTQMSARKTGALIVIPHKVGIQSVIDTGDTLDALISSRLLMNLFFKNSPLHDGAVVIAKGRITAARCTLPITSRTDIPASFGMRHRAAVGISEECDAEVIVVSEETGGISYIREGEITPIESKNDLINLLMNVRHASGE